MPVTFACFPRLHCGLWAFQTAGVIKIFGSNLMFLRKLTGQRDWSEENLAFGIESFELFVYARERCFECSRSWKEVPQVVKGVIHQSRITRNSGKFWRSRQLTKVPVSYRCNFLAIIFG